MKIYKPEISKPLRLKKALVNGVLAAAISIGLVSNASHAAVGAPEKEDLKFGFIKLTDMAPLAIAYEKGFFEDEGLL